MSTCANAKISDSDSKSNGTIPPEELSIQYMRRAKARDKLKSHPGRQAGTSYEGEIRQHHCWLLRVNALGVKGESMLRLGQQGKSIRGAAL